MYTGTMNAPFQASGTSPTEISWLNRVVRGRHRTYFKRLNNVGGQKSRNLEQNSIPTLLASAAFSMTSVCEFKINPKLIDKPVLYESVSETKSQSTCYMAKQVCEYTEERLIRRMWSSWSLTDTAKTACRWLEQNVEYI